jgi:hypothetical protein
MMANEKLFRARNQLGGSCGTKFQIWEADIWEADIGSTLKLDDECASWR